MSLAIEEKDREGIAILICKGKLVLGDETGELRDRTQQLLGEKKCNMILDMEHVDHIDSSGLGELISLDRDVRKCGGKLKLVALNQKNVDLLIMTKLSTVFDQFAEEQDAVNSFFPDRQISSFDLLEFVQDIKEEPK